MFSAHGFGMKKENCPFCGHRWIRKSSESLVECPNCRTEYFIQPRHEQLEDEEITEDEDTIADEFEERNL
jgi:predicted  nucleic acid-binding Zn-ribbon protein